MIKVFVSPDHTDWLYKPGETVKFNIRITKNNIPLQNADAYYELSYDMMPPLKKESVKLKNGELTINGSTMNIPGFCVAGYGLNTKIRHTADMQQPHLHPRT